MRAELKGMHSPDVDLADPEAVRVVDAALVQLMIGPAGAVGEESFDLVVHASGGDAAAADGDGFRPVDHALVLDRIDAAEVRRRVESFLRDLDRPTWAALAEAIGRIARWEFVGYRPAGEAGA
ncbi:Imm8 family immunity protein [Nocardia sp. NPDC004568]|uniref:Imm8 family immunity protein n=1 Tax=Nocardia sp. NPDC004568 TaxID=3154551 RepID=UPI0033AD95BF